MHIKMPDRQVPDEEATASHCHLAIALLPAFWNRISAKSDSSKKKAAGAAAFSHHF
ncbi:hypothetical protein [Hartmannibacter diazotrophicus]|uniref:hypothetical protein n=1 Tax=Hartmannibacter diazotrophicus TaxID=1482074 RepID=UPI0012FD4BD7|nr:hypothetical protein [Hartmannibacter diazotrophicus]